MKMIVTDEDGNTETFYSEGAFSMNAALPELRLTEAQATEIVLELALAIRVNKIKRNLGKSR